MRIVFREDAWVFGQVQFAVVERDGPNVIVLLSPTGERWSQEVQPGVAYDVPDGYWWALPETAAPVVAQAILDKVGPKNPEPLATQRADYEYERARVDTLIEALIDRTRKAAR